jgi:ribosomal protein S12 methylthiotransferase
MRRPGTRSSYERLLDRIRVRIAGVALRTTFIVGFPGETAEDFGELCKFVRQVGFDHVGVFTYSHEEGTAAHQLGDDVPTRVKRQRRGQLMALQKQLVIRANRGRFGDTVEVMVDGPSPDHALVLKGRLQTQAPEIDPVVYLTDADRATLRPGDLVRARIVSARGYDLVARPLP